MKMNYSNAITTPIHDVMSIITMYVGQAKASRYYSNATTTLTDNIMTIITMYIGQARAGS